MSFNALDIIFMLILIISIVRCTFKGFISEFMGMAAVLGGLLGGFLFYDLGAAFITRYFQASQWNKIIAFLIIFLSIYLLVKLIQGILFKIIEKIHLENLDNALGFILGIAEGLIAITVIILVLKIQPFFDMDQLLAKSVIAEIIVALAPALFKMQ